jgi:hypothetical protein
MFFIPVDKEKVLRKGIVAEKDSALILDRIRWSINKGSILKNELMQLDILATSEWDRPICFVAAGNEGALNLEPYFQLEGLAYLLVPISTPGRSFMTYGRIDVDTLYDRLMNTFHYGRMEQPDVYMDYYNIRTLSVIKLRNNFTRLANELITVHKLDSAERVLDRCMELMPNYKVPYDAFIPPITEAYFLCGATEKAGTIMRDHVDYLEQDLAYYYDLTPEQRTNLDYEIRLALQLLQEYNNLASDFKMEEINREISDQFSNYYQRYLQERR